MTDLRSSQTLSEVFVADTPRLQVTQALAEVWMQNQPPTALISSQTVAEVWLSVTSPQVTLNASQALVELWLGSRPRSLRVSAQVI
jgi:hypothetical protein